jgi:hypothetical protein
VKETKAMAAPANSLAQTYFERLVSGNPFQFLSGLVGSKSPTFESEWLEFHCGPAEATNGSRAVAETKLRAQLSESISAFSNTGGGVLVWGLDAKKDPESGDSKVQSLALVSDPPAFRARLQELIADSVDPPVSGVEVRDFSGPKGEGFVVCLVPQGAVKPYRALHASNQYFMRTSASSKVIPHALLRHMFYPRAASVLSCEVGVSWTERQNDVNLHIDLSVLNTGNRTSRELRLVVRSALPLVEVYPCLPWLKMPRFFLCNEPIHPGEQTPVFSAATPIPFASHIDARGLAKYPAVEKLRLEIEAFCCDEEPKRGHVEFQQAEVVGKTTKRVMLIPDSGSAE